MLEIDLYHRVGSTGFVVKIKTNQLQQTSILRYDWFVTLIFIVVSAILVWLLAVIFGQIIVWPLLIILVLLYIISNLMIWLAFKNS